MGTRKNRFAYILSRIRNYTVSVQTCSDNTPLYKTQVHYMLTESCLKVDESDNVLGHASKKDCHEIRNGTAPPLHRAFSFFLFRKMHPILPDSPLQLLIQRRSSFKLTYPNLWSNTCCSHPIANLPSEMVEEQALGVRRAAQRKVKHELGMLSESVLPLPSISFLTRILYFAPNESSGDCRWAEHELDYLLVSILDPRIESNLESGLVKINPEEVSDVRWIGEEELHTILSGDAEESTSDPPTLKRQDFTPWVRGLASSGYLRRIWRWAEKHDAVGGASPDSPSDLFNKDAIIRLST